MDSKNAPQLLEHISHSLNYTAYEAKWVPSSARLVSLGLHARGTGVLQVYDMEKGKLKMLAEVEQKEGIKCGTFGASLYEKRHIATGDYKGNLNIWDLEKLTSGPIYSTDAHTSIINTIDGIGGLNIGGGAPELVTGSRDGCVRIWDPRQKPPVASMEPAAGSAARDCWAVAFGNSYNDDERCVVAGYDNGDIKLLDLRTNSLRWETNVKSGVVSLEFDRRDIEMNKLLVTTLEARYRLFDMRTYHHEEGFSSLVEKCHKSTVWAGRHLPQNREIFVTGGGNGTLNLYKYQYPSQRVIKDEKGEDKGVMGTVKLLNYKKFSDQPIVSFDWHTDKAGLALMTCLDQTLKVAIVTKLNKV